MRSLMYLQDLAIGVNGRVRNSSPSLGLRPQSLAFILELRTQVWRLAFAASHLRSSI